MLTRRQLGERLLILPLLAGLRRAARAEGEPPSLARATLATGPLAGRLRLTADRLLRPPGFTPERVLADVISGPWSGDLAGRYLGALALLPPAGLDLAALVRELLGRQRADGRFGDADLRFASAEVGAPHRALLWGNGRLLVGLLEYVEATGDGEALLAARRLGDFLVGAREAAAGSGVVAAGGDVAEPLGVAHLAEGFALLSEATDERRYAEAARAGLGLLGPRGTQAAQGYLTALRGLLRLATGTGDPLLLQDVESRYRHLVASEDLSPYGGVMELFGESDAPLAEEQRRRLASPGGRPHEGCAVADFLRLSLQLWRATSNLEYLERAEHCLLNHFYFTQIDSGDFGGHVPDANGFLPAPGGGVSGCCTLSGYRAFRDVLDGLVRREKDTTFVDLFEDADVTLPGLSVSVLHASEGPASSRLTVEVLEADPSPQGLALRRPSWAASTLVLVEGHKVWVRPGPYVIVQRKWRAGESVEMVLEHAVRLETRDRRSLEPSALAGETEALLFLGPWLLAADDATSPAFFSAPERSAVVLPSALAAASAPSEGGRFAGPGPRLRLRCRSASPAGPQSVVLSPLGERTDRPPAKVAAWLRYRGQQ